MLLTEILPQAVAGFPDEEAVSCAGLRLSYRELGSRVARLCAALEGLGVVVGDRVAVLHRNCHRMLELYFAAVHCGAVLVPLNHRLTARDLAFILDDTESRVLVADDGWSELAREAAERSSSGCRLVWSRIEGDIELHGGAADYEQLIVASAAGLLDRPPGFEDAAVNLYYTSGTTGRQKGVILTHRNISSHALATVAELSLEHRDVWLHAAPMFHLADAWATWAVTWAGGRHVMAGRFVPQQVLRLLVDERITITNLVPTMLNDLVTSPEAGTLSYPSLRLLMSGGAPISPALVRRVVETFGCEYVQTYGLTETSPYLTFSLLDDKLRQLPVDRQMVIRSKTGRPCRGVELRVVDPEGRDVPADGRSVGEIVARSERITPGYWKLSEATAEAFRDGWFYTGDLATLDSLGYLDIVDRAKDVILTGGETVYSTEVEHVLHEHPSVLEVAVVGLPDERLGERVHAEVVARDGCAPSAEGLIAHCRHLIAHFKCPRSLVFVDALPRTGSGKIAKRLIRERHRS